MTGRPRNIELVCACCGKPFSATRRDARFCSQVCNTLAYAQKIHLRRIAGIEVKRKPRNRILGATSRRGPRTRDIHLVCIICGKPFSTAREDAKVCSQKCRDVAYSQTKHSRRMDELANEQPTPKKKRAKKIPSTPTKWFEPPPGLLDKELIDLPTLCYVTTISRTAMYRILDDPMFPKIKIRGSVRFHKETAIAYILNKYTIQAVDSRKKTSGTKELRCRSR